MYYYKYEFVVGLKPLFQSRGNFRVFEHDSVCVLEPNAGDLNYLLSSVSSYLVVRYRSACTDGCSLSGKPAEVRL